MAVQGSMVRRPSSFKTTTSPSARLRKAVLRLQVRQMDRCSLLNLCISRAQVKLRLSGCHKGNRPSTRKPSYKNSPSTKKIIPAWSFNHSIENIVSSFKNYTNSQDKTAENIFLTALACGNRLSEVTEITREDLSFTADYVILSTKSNFLHKN